jgi:hypothetical protein
MEAYSKEMQVSLESVIPSIVLMQTRIAAQCGRGIYNLLHCEEHLSSIVSCLTDEAPPVCKVQVRMESEQLNAYTICPIYNERCRIDSYSAYPMQLNVDPRAAEKRHDAKAAQKAGDGCHAQFACWKSSLG